MIEDISFSKLARRDDGRSPGHEGRRGLCAASRRGGVGGGG